jgi:multiple RNA-binding domain-containing protein 1
MTSRIIVKGLPKKCSEEKFKEHFSKIAVVTDVSLKFNKEGKFRQFGFIGYKTEADANKAIQYFNNTFMDASKMIVIKTLYLHEYFISG